MAYKTQGSGALKPDDGSELKVRIVKNPSITRKGELKAKVSSAFDVETEFTPKVVEGGLSARPGGSTSSPRSSRPLAARPAARPSASEKSENIAKETPLNRPTGFGNGANSFDDLNDTEEKDNLDDEIDDAIDDAEEEAAEEAAEEGTEGAAEGDTTEGADTEGDENSEGDENPEEGNENGENGDEKTKEEENLDDAGGDAAMAAAGTTATVGAAAAAGEQASADEDSGNLPSAGTNPVMNEENNSARANAQNDLKNSEKNAASNDPGKADTDDAKKKEDNPEAGFKNSTIGKAADAVNKIDPRKKALEWMRKQGPIGLVMAIVLAVTFLITGSQGLLMFAVSSAFLGNYESMDTVAQARSKTMFIRQWAGEKANVPRSSLQANYEVDGAHRAKLAQNNIYLVQDGDTKIALYDDKSGSLKVVAQNDTDATSYRSKNLDFSSFKSQLPDSYDGPRSIDTSDAASYNVKIKSDQGFDMNFAKGTRTFAGAVVNWFDRRSVQFLKRWGITRRLFKNWIAAKEGDADAGTDNISKLRKVSAAINDEVDSEGGEAKVRKTDVEDEQNEDGTTKPKINTSDSDAIELIPANSKASTVAESVNHARDVAKKAMPGKKTQQAVTIPCLVLYTAGSISLLMAARQVAQLLPTISAFMEAVDKTKAGSSDAPFDELAAALVIPAVASLIVANSSGGYEAQNLEAKSAIQGNALSSLLTGTKMNQNDPMVSSFNIGKFGRGIGAFLSSLTGISGLDEIGETQSFVTCSILKGTINLAQALARGAVAIVAIAGCIGTGFVGCIVAAGAAGAATEFMTDVAWSEAKAAAMMAFQNYVVPAIATVLVREITTDLFGEQFGTALAAGAGIYLSRNHLFGGGTPSTRKQYVTYQVAQRETNARNAAIERSTKSPFDYTSQYTFAGVMLKQIAAFSSTMTSPLKVFSTIGTMTKSSIASLMPSAVAAADEINSGILTDEELEENCPYLASIGAVGDAFCNPYIVSDMNTIEDDPEEVASKVQDLGGLNDDGSIKDGSDLAKYIIYCNGRTSSFGIVDYNIANSVSDTSLIKVDNGIANTAINTAVSSVPIVGDVLDVFSEGEKLANTGYITGEQCVAGNTTSGDWESETRYYQRYVEDERLLEGLSGGDYTSPVTSFIDEYDKAHPVDNSYEGILARFSGFTKDQVVATLDMAEYINYIANYDPSTRLLFGDTTVASIPANAPRLNRPLIDTSSDDDTIEEYVLPSNKFIYTDFRHRYTTSA